MNTIRMRCDKCGAESEFDVILTSDVRTYDDGEVTVYNDHTIDGSVNTWTAYRWKDPRVVIREITLCPECDEVVNRILRGFAHKSRDASRRLAKEREAYLGGVADVIVARTDKSRDRLALLVDALTTRFHRCHEWVIDDAGYPSDDIVTPSFCVMTSELARFYGIDACDQKYDAIVSARFGHDRTEDMPTFESELGELCESEVIESTVKGPYSLMRYGISFREDGQEQ